MSTYVALIRDGRGLLTGSVSENRAAMLISENPGAIRIEACDRTEAFEKMVRGWAEYFGSDA